VADLLQAPDRLAADALRGRVGALQLRVLALELAQLVEQAVVGVVADLGVVEDVVAVTVVIEGLAQLGRALSWVDGLAQGSVTSSTAESIRRARS
jgi:hypothetical protein